eukprot:scaffold8264_cov109-Isochrysis_galbana.AAC.16
MDCPDSTELAPTDTAGSLNGQDSIPGQASPPRVQAPWPTPEARACQSRVLRRAFRRSGALAVRPTAVLRHASHLRLAARFRCWRPSRIIHIHSIVI